MYDVQTAVRLGDRNALFPQRLTPPFPRGRSVSEAADDFVAAEDAQWLDRECVVSRDRRGAGSSWYLAARRRRRPRRAHALPPPSRARGRTRRPEAGDEACVPRSGGDPRGAALDRQSRDLVHGRERIPRGRRALVRRRESRPPESLHPVMSDQRSRRQSSSVSGKNAAATRYGASAWRLVRVPLHDGRPLREQRARLRATTSPTSPSRYTVPPRRGRDLVERSPAQWGPDDIAARARRCVKTRSFRAPELHVDRLHRRRDAEYARDPRDVDRLALAVGQHDQQPLLRRRAEEALDWDRRERVDARRVREEARPRRRPLDPDRALDRRAEDRLVRTREEMGSARSVYDAIPIGVARSFARTRPANTFARRKPRLAALAPLREHRASDVEDDVRLGVRATCGERPSARRPAARRRDRRADAAAIAASDGHERATSARSDRSPRSCRTRSPLRVIA